MNLLKSITILCVFCLCCLSAVAQDVAMASLPTATLLSKTPIYSILESTNTSKVHKTLAEVLKATDLDNVLDSEGPFTVFAPSDAAFNSMSKEEMLHLLKPENKEKLHNLLAYHIVAGNLSAAKILKALCNGKGKTTFTTVQGNKIYASMDGIDIVLKDSLGNEARIVKADSKQCNGVIHTVDKVIRP